MAIVNDEGSERLKWETFRCKQTNSDGNQIEPISIEVGQDRYGTPKFMCRIIYNGYNS